MCEVLRNGIQIEMMPMILLVDFVLDFSLSVGHSDDVEIPRTNEPIEQNLM